MTPAATPVPSPTAPGVREPGPVGLPRLLVGLDDGATDLAAHTRRFGPVSTSRVNALGAEVERAGLSGRGGASFPTATKLASVARSGGGVVIINATEGEPAACKDHLLTTRAPHLVLDGAVLAAAVVGAAEVYVCVGREDREALRVLGQAIAERPAHEPSVVLLAAPHRYVSGEATALTRWVGGGDAKPVWGVRPDERGVRRRSTLVQNAETVAHLALVARFGADWFRSIGTGREPGSALVTVAGDVERPGVSEVAFGTPLARILDQAGLVGQPQALLFGGYGGSWVGAADAAALCYSNKDLRRVGASVGAGLVAVLGADRCGLAETARLARWMADENAGQCGPCQFGLPAVADALDRVAWGGSSRADLARLHRWLVEIDGRGGCAHPDLTVRMIASALRTFAVDVERHLTTGPCEHVRRHPLLPVPDLRGEPWR